MGLEKVNKQDNLDELYKLYFQEFSHEEIVVGHGNCDAKIILVGEAPGRDEVKMSKPFVGAAGKNLSKFLEILGVSREDIYITNAIKYRLSKQSVKTGRLINRPALNKDIECNYKYLIKEIDIIQPNIIATLGNVPLRTLAGKSCSIGEMHGKMCKLEILDKNYLLFPLYHPASIIYNKSLEQTYLADLMILGDYLKK
jgi:uracil-DNA glycosylase family 4